VEEFVETMKSIKVEAEADFLNCIDPQEKYMLSGINNTINSDMTMKNTNI
jgi:hypothetical protein